MFVDIPDYLCRVWWASGRKGLTTGWAGGDSGWPQGKQRTPVPPLFKEQKMTSFDECEKVLQGNTCEFAMPTFLYNSVTSRHQNLIAITFYIKMKSKRHNLCDNTIATIVIIHNYTYDEECRTWKVKKCLKALEKTVIQWILYYELQLSKRITKYANRSIVYILHNNWFPDKHC